MTPLAAPEVKRLDAEIDAIGADGTFTGHACLFGVEDLARDVVEPGAFRATLARRGASGVKMLWHHDPAEPIGRWLDIREDARGLFVRGRVLADVARGREALALMRAGILDGLSIGFRTVKGVRDGRSGLRRLAEIDLWEISLVTFPMQPAARVASVEAARGLRPNGCVASVEAARGLRPNGCVASVEAARGLRPNGCVASVEAARGLRPDASDVSSARLVAAIRAATALVTAKR